MDESAKPPKHLFGAIAVGLIPGLMGGAVMFFTTGVTFRCTGTAPGQVECAEGRRILGVFNLPVRRFHDVRGAVAEQRTFYDQDGDTYQRDVTVILTAAGRKDVLPSGAGGSLDGIAQEVDQFAKKPTAGGLALGRPAQGALFFAQLFGGCFVYLGIWNFGGYLFLRALGVFRRS
jgi:hypothetical protein